MQSDAWYKIWAGEAKTMLIKTGKLTLSDGSARCSLANSTHGTCHDKTNIFWSKYFWYKRLPHEGSSPREGATF